ncbi:aldo/keto reductase [Phanerochaete sordida]|uniref:Aldo/keto reductase n=1 Tax=Phanerochaete sordida TaxID=48140 RepID=A0A9P3LEY2_9APHY|nr:aldo/keto reductase [Phanerochaete sordida]
MTACRIIYGTAWKKERTASLVVSAVLSGFRAIDTAGQPKHYREDLVGEALHTLQTQHGIKREDLFLQTKFTSVDGQDMSKPIPYDASAELETQIRASFSNSLKNLRTSYVDSYILHSPLDTLARTLVAWKALIALQDAGKVRHIGVSNTYDVRVLEALEQQGGRRVQVVQNRWYEGNKWDAEVFAYCRKHSVQYQSFWTLTGSPTLLSHSAVTTFAQTKGISPAQAVYKLAQLSGITPLSGTTKEEHMKADLEVENVQVDAQDKENLDAAMRWMGLQI